MRKEIINDVYFLKVVRSLLVGTDILDNYRNFPHFLQLHERLLASNKHKGKWCCANLKIDNIVTVVLYFKIVFVSVFDEC